FVELETDGCACFLRDLVFNREVKIVGTVSQALERTLVLSQHRGADARNVVEIDAGKSQVTQILRSCDFDAAQLREIWFVCPAKKARQPARFILKTPRALEMLETLVEGFVEADDHRGRCIQSC